MKSGINIQNLDFKTFHIGQLYIKLDKKLILATKDIQINTQNNDKDFSSDIDILNLTRKINLLNSLFSSIVVENLHYGDLKFDMVFQDGLFFVDMPYVRLNASFDTKGDKIIIDTKEVALKDFNATICGTGVLDGKSYDYDFKGTFVSHEVNGDLRLRVQKNKLYYNFSNVYATSLKGLMREIEENKWIDKEVKEWIYGHIIAREYFIQNLSGMMDLKNKNMHFDYIEGSANAKDLKIKFDKSVKEVNVDDANISLKNGVLSFVLNNPKYYDKSLDGSSVAINDLFGNNTNIDINIKTDSLLDEKVQDILKAYDINIPIIQKKGELKTDLYLNITFKNLLTKASGVFELKNADINISKSPFFSKYAKIILENNSLVRIENSHLSNSFLDAKNLNGDIYIDKNSAKFEAICNLDIKANEKNSIVKFEQKPLHIDMNFEKNATILDINELNTKIILSDLNLINIQSLSDVVQYSSLLNDIGIKSGSNLDIKTKDFEDFDISAQNVIFDVPFIKKDGTKYDMDSFKFIVSKDYVKGYSKGDFFNFSYKKDLLDINLKNLDFIYQDSVNNDENSSDELLVHINAQNSNLILLDLNKTIPFDSYSGDIKGKNIELLAKKDNGNFHLISNNDKLILNATKLNGEFLNSLFGSKSFEGGKFDLHLLGRNAKNYNAEIILKDTYLKDYIFYHQLLTFLNTIPSLLVFKTPDFNSDGFTVNSGKIYINRNGDILNFKAINLTGTSADIGGRGIINLGNKQIDIDLELKLLKDASSIINKIPLVNQIILGKERTISTVIKISGTMDEPKYSTQILQDTLLTPFNIIKNTLELPFVLFE
ncbi:DUF3971, AsmA domain protein [Campylobacter sputorum bv. faecalis CCUG 20703]|nr:DUF3971, AsmA domain protein [Campylobacter sputorum bv. faecalis CCUG 20703]